MKTILFNNLYLNDYYLLISKEEKHHLKKYNEVMDDFYYNEKSFEQSEIKMQEKSIQSIINNNHLSDRDIDLLIGSDLNGQITASSYSSSNFNIPFLGVYAACASFTEELLLAGILNKSGDANKIITSISSHALTAERQFRYPIEYGHSRPMTSTVTATGAVSTLISNNPSKIKIVAGTIGKTIDMGVKDVNHMGAVMAPACANTLYHHLHNLNKSIKDYDLILTGDLGQIGISLLKEYYYKSFHERIDKVIDSGNTLYMNMKDKYSGGSGPCCLPLVLLGNIIHQKKYHRILLLGTGALHNTTLINQKLSIPSVCHAVEIEVLT